MRHTERQVVERSPEAVWAFITELDNWTEWFGQFEGRQISEGPLELGTTLLVKFGRWDVKVEVTRFEPLSHLDFRFYLGPFEWQEGFRLQEAGSDTAFLHTIDVRFRNLILRVLGAVFNPFGGLLMRKQIRAEVMSLKHAVESR